MTVLGRILFALVYPALAAGAPVDVHMGNFEGEWTAQSGASGKVTAKIIGRGQDDYKAIFAVERDGEVTEVPLKLDSKKDGEKLTYAGKLDMGPDAGGTYEWTATSENGTFTMHGESSEETFDLKMERVEKKPPTLGAKPPEGAVVLFDGDDLEQWTDTRGGPAKWKIVDGVMEVARGTMKSKPTFKDAKLHLEFRTPYLPLFRGQFRGNSGVYLQGRYEIQVLDSFGEPPRDNEAGGIYQAAVPKLNASLPPGEWQTYDITFHAPRFDEKGERIKPAQVTVLYNGELIHDQVEIGNTTPGGSGGDPKEPGPLLLQDHGNPVQFRNIWYVPLEGNEES